MLIYIHGFNSSAQSYKARLLGEAMRLQGLEEQFACPELHHRPAQAMAQLEALIAPAVQHGITLAGSSLGGFYATSLAERFGVRAVLVNPAVRPYDLLAGLLGPQQNLYTGESYVLTDRHIEELRQLEVDRVTPARYLLITATGDEVLDYRGGVERYAGCEKIIVEGSDHGFREFGDYIPQVIAWWQQGRV